MSLKTRKITQTKFIPYDNHAIEQSKIYANNIDTRPLAQLTKSDH